MLLILTGFSGILTGIVIHTYINTRGKERSFEMKKSDLNRQRETREVDKQTGSAKRLTVIGLIGFVVVLVVGFIFFYGFGSTDYTAQLESTTVQVNELNEFAIHGVTDAPQDGLSVHFDGASFHLTHYDSDNGYFMVETSADEDQPETTEFELKHEGATVLKETIKLVYASTSSEDVLDGKEDLSDVADEEKEKEKSTSNDDEDDFDLTTREGRDAALEKEVEGLISPDADENISSQTERPRAFVAKAGEHDGVIQSINKELSSILKDDVDTVMKNGFEPSIYYQSIESIKEIKYEGDRKVTVTVNKPYELLYPEQLDLLLPRVSLLARTAVRRAEFWDLEAEEGSLDVTVKKEDGSTIETFNATNYKQKGKTVQGDGIPRLTREEVKAGKRKK